MADDVLALARRLQSSDPEVLVMLWLTMAPVWAAPCAEVTFTFAGQPACVRLEVETVDAIRLTNACAGPVLVDRRALPRAPQTAVVAPGGSVLLAGVSAFTLGAEGALHAVTAVAQCEKPARAG